VFLGSRVGQLAFSALMASNDRRRFSQPGLQAGLLAGLGVEAAWLGRRIVRSGGYDDRVALWLDTAANAAALLVSQRGLGDGAPWVKNVAIGSAIGASSATRRGDYLAAVGVLGASAVAAGFRARGRDAHAAGLALGVNDAISWIGMSLAARYYLTAHRQYARLRDEADALTVERASAAAAQDERSRQHEALHRVTISVLRRIAETDEPAPARDIAAAEASRLRLALRNDGRLPDGLLGALAGCADLARASGLQVELVTEELATPVSPEVAAAVRDAVNAALSVALELGGAAKAVVRGYDDEGVVRVSVRDHGRGFDPVQAGDYGARTAALAVALGAAGGTAKVWSEPGAGVRVDLEVPALGSAGGGDDPVHGLPDLGVRHAPAGDHDDPVADAHVQVRGGAGLGAAQHEVGVPGVADGHVRVASDPFQARAQQCQLGGDAYRRSAAHLSRLTDRVGLRVGVSTQFRGLPAAETQRADRTLLAALLTWRATGLATGTASLIGGAGRYRSTSGAAVQLLAAAAESAWFARRLLALPRWSDRDAALLDAGTATALLVTGRAVVAARDRTTWINWVPWSFAANAVCGQAMSDHDPRAQIAGAAAVIAAHAAQGPYLGDAVANAVAQTSFFGTAGFFARQIRGGAVRLGIARDAAVHEQQTLARARERAVQLRLLHDSAVQTLEAVAGGRHPDLESTRRRAAAEADLLETELRRTGETAADLVALVRSVVDEHGGLDVTLRVGPVQAPPASVARALAGACHEALTNVAKHAGTGRAVVTVSSIDARVVLEVADNGVGFVPELSDGGFGMEHSIRRRMADAGGAARVRSRPGAGTVVELRWPA
jgi:signal transduction histidine kinase